MKLTLLLPLAACCATGALGYYAGVQSASTTPTPVSAIPAPPNTPPLRIAIVDAKRVFDAHPQTKDCAAALNAMRAEAKTEQQRLKDSGELVAAMRFTDKRTKEIKAESDRLREQIVTEIRAIIDKHATTNELNLVLDSSGKSLNGVPIVLRATGITDITEDVLHQISP